MKGPRFVTNQRGSVLLFTTVTLFLLLIFGGIAIDLTYVGSAKGELQRSMDAAALAGAGKLGFDDTVFPAVRQEAWTYANVNPYRVGTITPDLNPANAPGGDIVLGIWENGGFTPSLDGSRVNAVRCQVATQIPTSFLSLLGFNTLQVGAFATAVANPPETVPGACVFPIGLTDCPFQGNTSDGCGAPITFISSSGKEPVLDTAGTNTAAWVNPFGTETPNVPMTKSALEAAAAGGTCNNSLENGEDVGTNNGMQQTVFDLLETLFVEKYASSGTVTIEGTPGYTGPGWEVIVPVLNFSESNSCPPQAINGVQTINGWTRMVITQVVNHGDCAVANSSDPNSWQWCPPPMNPAGPPKDPGQRAVFGYYECEVFSAPPSLDPGPRSAIAGRMRLVQ
ncbi:MAG: pilus assembly protein TadG-related protein [Candidatus Methylomirabilia bacterium]